MNIYIRELKAYKKSIILWTIFAFLFVAMGMQKYSAIYSGGSEEMMKLMDQLPQSLKAIFGMSKLDITTLIGYYGVLYLYLVLMVGIHASMLGSGIINKEEKEKTAEFLMTKPVTRSKILTNKLLSSITMIIILNIVTFISSIIMFASFKEELPIYTVLILNIGMLFMQMIYLIVGIFLASILKKSKKSGMISMFLILFTYFLSLIIDIWNQLKVLRIFTPFKYFDAKDIIPSNSLNVWYILLSITIMVFLLYYSYKMYNERDLNL
jgi:ABC-2 type transport system permease protein